MSILNAFVMPDAALVAVDTEAFLPDGQTAERSKMLAVPHLSTVVAFRGLDLVFMAATPFLIGFTGDFDDLADRMEEIVTQAFELSRPRWGDLGPNADAAEHANVVLVGYSPKHGRVMGHAYIKTPEHSRIQHFPDFPQILAPNLTRDEVARLEIVADRAGMMKLAAEQCRITRERGPAGTPAGGKLLIAEVTKDGIRIEKACDLPRQHHSRAGGAQ